ncbi:MAG: hypothetical protein WCI74_20625, partial [Actinomycetes bacterium]
PGSATDAFSASTVQALDQLYAREGEGPLGTLLLDKLTIIESDGQTLDGFTWELCDPDGVVHTFTYQHNVGTVSTFLRRVDASGVESRTLTGSKTYETPRSGDHDAADPRLSEPPGVDFILAINEADAVHRAKQAALHPVEDRADPLTVLGIVGIAKAGTAYDQSQDYSDLSFGLMATRYGTGNHNATLNTSGYWYGGLGLADPGDTYDGMDGEWDPSDMVLSTVGWAPSGTDMKGPFGWHSTHNINMTNAGSHSVLGGSYQKPDKNSKYNDLYIKVVPKNTSVYGNRFNVFGNFTHTWNYSLLTGVSFSVTFGAFSISYQPAFTGSWNRNVFLLLTV